MLASATPNNPSLLIIEFGMAAMAAIISFGWPDIAGGCFRRIENLSARLARRRGLAALTVGASAILLRISLLPLFPVPLPFVPDDFSFLLAADTYAHGRLTNPTPVMWTHFETIHETMRPTYQSMYFPGQGLVLAAGQILFHQPWAAVLVVMALMCAAFTWMLQGWLSPKWALLGGFIALLRLGLFTLWINSYHTAGALAALGGALVLGALPRLMKWARFRDGLLMGVGVAILELTRPYEGLLLCIPVAAVLSIWAWRGVNRPPVLVLARRAAVPLGIVVGAGAWLGYYDHVAFGKMSTLPYTVDHAIYGAAPYYIWQKPTPAPHYRHEFLRAFYQNSEDKEFYNGVHSIRGFIPYTAIKLIFNAFFFTGFTFLLPLMIGWRAFLARRLRLLIFCLLAMGAGLSIEIYLLPYYIAAFVPAFYAFGMQALRHVWVWRPEGKRVGRALVRLTVVSCVALGVLRAFAQPLHIAPPEWPASNWILLWFGPAHYGEERAQVESRLEQLPGEQLAIVRYGPNHWSLDQWIYNSADIDHAKVIWAGEMDPADDQKLLKYYRNRTAWLIEPDANPVRITPYPGQMAVAATASSQGPKAQ